MERHVTTVQPNSTAEIRCWESRSVGYMHFPVRTFLPLNSHSKADMYFRFAVALTLCSLLLDVGIRSLGADATITAYGLGVIHTDTIIDIRDYVKNADTLLFNVILANTPQVVMSLIYVNYNALLTDISLATEWDRFGKERKGLRVSSGPEGYQRQRHFLQLPYRYSLPLAGFSTLLNWLISQSIFFVVIEAYQTEGIKISVTEKAGTEKMKVYDEVIPLYSRSMSCGWSPVGIVCVIVAAVVMVGFLIILGCRRLRCGGIPMAASCSAAISAACHPIPEEPDAWKKEVCWGVTRDPKAAPRNCSFSSEPVESPVKGALYR